MDECLERDWAHDRGRLVGQLMPVGASTKLQQTRSVPHSRNESAPLLLQGANGTHLSTHSPVSIALILLCSNSVHKLWHDVIHVECHGMQVTLPSSTAGVFFCMANIMHTAL